MNNELDLDLSELEVYQEEPSPSGEVYEKSLGVVRDAMKDVIQEILIELPDGTAHIVYIMGLKFSDKNQIEVDFNTPSEDRKDELYVHVEKCVRIQLQEYFSKNKKSWFKRG